MEIPKLVLATNNQHKADEIRQVLAGSFEVETLKDAGIHIDIPEPHDTLEENAREKSTTIYKLTGVDCFSEDTGLEVAALNGAPGVKSARYAGEENDAAKNRQKLLRELENQTQRQARFRTVISLILDGKEYQFEGICEGDIAREEVGEKGFGYDSIFIPKGSTKSFSEMSMEQKAQHSHRRKATDQLIAFLKTRNGQD